MLTGAILVKLPQPDLEPILHGRLERTLRRNEPFQRVKTARSANSQSSLPNCSMTTPRPNSTKTSRDSHSGTAEEASLVEENFSNTAPRTTRSHKISVLRRRPEIRTVESQSCSGRTGPSL